MTKKKTPVLPWILAVVAVVIIATISFVVAGARENSVNSDPSVNAEAQGIVIGEVDPKLPNLDVYFDYTCYHCAVAEDNLGDFMFEEAGNSFNLVLHPVRTVGYPYTELATEAMLITSTMDPNNLQAFHSDLMAFALDAYNSEDQSVLTDYDKSYTAITEIASSIGIPEDVIAKFPKTPSNYLDEATKAWVSAPIERPGDQIGTPEFVLDGVVVERDASYKSVDLKTFRENVMR